MTAEQLKERAQAVQSEWAACEERLQVCVAAGCLACGAQQVREALEAAVSDAGRKDKVRVSGTGCLGLCSRGPLVRSTRHDCTYSEVETADAGRLVAGELADRRLTIEHPFYKSQQRIVLENSGVSDPEDIYSYIGAGGYSGLARAITEYSPAEVIGIIKQSGLRGRGGAGYPTGIKWELVAKQIASPKYVICNADEGDPGAFMDRSVLEGDPHRVLEGMAIAGYAVGSAQGYVYVRGEYDLPIERLQNAIRQAEREHLLGARILETGYSFRIDVRIGAGAFVCGEETALIASIEGKRGQPVQRPPYPPERGLWGLPTMINNVETFANVPPILRNGADWFSKIGTATSKGTKVFAFTGRIRNAGLVEVPMGTKLDTLIHEIGGGIPDGGTFKAAQTGGPSGGCIPARFLDLPVDYESLASIGSIMGSGGLIVMDNSSCMVDIARFFMEFCMDESCGKCLPCRAGTVQMHEILRRLTLGQASAQDLELLEELCGLLKDTSLCGLGQSAPNPVVSTLRYFREEYEAHLKDHHCPAGTCPVSRIPAGGVPA